MIGSKIKLTLLTFSILCGLIPATCYSQYFDNDFKPVHNYRLGKASLDKVKANCTEQIRTFMPSFDPDKKLKNADFKKNERSWLKAYTLLTNDIGINYRDSLSLYLPYDTSTYYIKKIVQRIIDNNPILKGKKFEVLGLREDVPNAYACGLYTISVYQGLIKRYKTESDLAFVICHEISHDILSHILKGRDKELDLAFDEKLQKEYEDASKQEFNSSKKLEELNRKYTAALNKHGRNEELQADSLGLILFTNAGYKPDDAVVAMSQLDSVDYPFYRSPIDFERYFNFQEYPFQHDWLNTDESTVDIGGNLEKLFEIPDSLKTHPDTKIRAQRLEDLISTLHLKADHPLADIANYDYFRRRAEFETVETLLYYSRYGQALYSALEMLNEYPENVYLKCVVANCLYEINKAQLNHDFSSIVQIRNNFYSKSYNDFLDFLHNVSSTDVKNFAIQYYKLNVEKYSNSNAYAGYVATLIQSMDKPKETYPMLADAYSRKFRDSYYADKLNQNFKPHLVNNKK